jgi:hypothetical protein
MKKITLVAAFLVSAMSTSAQNYTLDPSNTVTVTAPYNTISIFDIYQVSTASTKIQLKWETLNNGLVAGWDFSLCDYGHCLAGLPPSGTMDSVEVGGMGFLGLNVNPYSIPGTGIVKMYVYENGFYANGDTLTWIVNAGPSGISESSVSGTFAMYPNPASETVNLLVSGQETTCLVYDALGALVKSFNVSPTEGTKMDVSDLSRGIYFVRLFDLQKKEIGLQKLIISR